MRFFFLMVSLSLFVNVTVFCQIDINYSKEERLEWQLESGETKMLGENRQYVYVIMRGSDYLTSESKKLIAYNKADMSKAYECKLSGFKETDLDPESSTILARGILLNSIVSEEKVVFFWGVKGIIYAFTFNEKLSAVGSPKIMIDLQNATNRNTDVIENPEIFQSTTAAFFTLINDSTRTIAVGAEVSTRIGEKIQVYYALYDYDMNDIVSGNVEEPMSTNSNLEKLSSQYKLGSDNNLYFVSVVNPVMVGMNEYYYNFITGQVNTKDQTVSFIDNRQDGYILSELTLVNTNNNVSVVGFYCDMEYDSKGRSNHGVYVLHIDPASELSAENAQYTAFSKEQNHQMEFASKEGLSPQQTGWEKFNQSTIKVLDVDQLQDHSLLLTLSSIKYINGYISGKSYGVCKYVYLLKLNEKGEIVWISGSDAKGENNLNVYVGNTTVTDNVAITYIPGKGMILCTDFNSGDYIRKDFDEDKKIRYVYSESNIYAEFRRSKLKRAYIFAMPAFIFTVVAVPIVLTSEFSQYQLYKFGKLSSDK